MSESTKKSKARTNFKFNSTAISKLATRFGLSEYYIRQSVKGDRIGITPDNIRKEYKIICKKLDAIL